ncbi:hypothetical protein LUZ63_016079 [Rhynchospora breviuscula]|uniref:Glycosyltransferase family 92 protein n=1 Tax=Rhynchospora breviuscula TaxID=2022672 RepID=A0A9Q0CEA8_9POAL|nr:hypothetical protein LUZ63_016079 [Rhynchospora breviuscula]
MHSTMAKEKETKEKGLFVGLAWSCGDMKLLLTFLFFLCSLATIIQFHPYLTSVPHTTTLLSCLVPPTPEPTANSSSTSVATTPHPMKRDQMGPDSVFKRSFNPIGSAAYLFIQMSAYRGGTNTFAVIGLASKPLHVFAKPQFKCEWIDNPDNGNGSSVSADGYKILPDWGYGRVYTVVVVNCTFEKPVGLNSLGGQLVVHASTNGGGDRDVDSVESFVAIEEEPSSVNGSVFTAPPDYDYLYCGSPLYGNLSPQRIREWIVYHVKLFGRRAHFVIYDAGGIHAAVMDVLRPWIEFGAVTLHDIRDQERFDGYYHNQFLVVNDCLHRYRFNTKWMFFFDVDEFVYLEPGLTIDSLLKELEGYTQFTIEQMPMSNKICLADDKGKSWRMWGFEKLVYRDVKRGIRRDRKYAIQPRYAFATGVHMSQNIAGKSLHKTEGRIKYFHYHGTIANRREPCAEFSNTTELRFDRTPYMLDETLRRLAGSIKRFELKTIGDRLVHTRQ